VQKHAKQLNCDANSKRFKDAMRYLWMPHLVDIDIAAVAADDHHHLSLLHHHQQQVAVAGAGNGDLAAAGYAATNDVQLHALSSGMAAMTTTTSSSDSLASESYEDGGGLFANVRTGEMLMSGGDWAAQEANNQGLWPSSDYDQSMQVQAAAGGGQFQDPELSGWVQGFSESITDNFWALEEIWKMQ
jgi:myb proto-oncogene protein